MIFSRRKGFRDLATISAAASLLVVSSMVSLAAPAKPIADLSVVGNSAVLVNGEPAETGRAVTAGSTITTGEDSSATVTIQGRGSIEITPNSSFTIGSETDNSAGQVVSGSVRLLSAEAPLAILNSAGEAVSVGIGETVTASGTKSAGRDRRDKDGNCIDTDNDGKLECSEGLPPWGWVVIAAGVAAAVILAVALSDNDGAPSVSPIR